MDDTEYFSCSGGGTKGLMFSGLLDAFEDYFHKLNISYEDFRTRMPAEVDDNIVQLIYYNQDAFADFAEITSQDDVYAFNNKYGVSLVLPFDTETT